jgi:lipoprotein NlpI
MSKTILRSGALFFLFVCNASAQPEEDWKLCRASDSAKGVPACTRLINNTKLSKTDRADAYFERGGFATTVDSAIADYTKAIDLDPGLAKAYNSRGNKYYGKADFGKAVADFTKAIEIQPASAPYYSNRGSALTEMGNPNRAIFDFDKSIEIDPKRPFVFLRRGNAYKVIGNLGRAADDYFQAGKLATEGREIASRIADLLAIDHVEQAADLINGVSDYDTMMKLKVLRKYEKLWTNPIAVEALSLQAARAREIAKAKAATLAKPGSISTRSRLISTLNKDHKYAEAERIGYETLSMKPDPDDDDSDPIWVRGNLAVALVLQEKVERAKAVMEAVPAPSQPNTVPGVSTAIVSVWLNYGDALVNNGFFGEGFRVGENTKGNLNAYADTVRKRLQACAAMKMGRQSEAEAIATSMLAKASDFNENTVEALLCTDREAEAAATLISQLAKYPGELTDYQGCAEDPASGIVRREIETKSAKILERPDVRKVVDPIGRTRQECQ